MTGLHDRAKLRLNQQRKLEHACSVIAGLIGIHMPGEIGEREIAELAMMASRLMLLIKHQHVIDRDYAEQKIESKGDY